MQNAEEIRNTLLAEINNNLAKISKFMEARLALIAKLYPGNIDALKEYCGEAYVSTDEFGVQTLEMFDDCTVGYSKEKGLHQVLYCRHGQEKSYPLGDYETSHPIDEDGSFIPDSRIKESR